VGLGLALLLVVPLVVDARSLGRKAGQSTIGTATVKGAAQLLAGTAEPWLLGAVAALVLGGWVWLARRQPRLTAYAAFLAACLLAVPVVTRPASITVSIVLARYCLPLLPLGLLGAAAGLVQLESALQRRVSAWPAGGLAVVAVGLLLAFGPLPAVYYSPNNWTSHALFQYEYDPTSPYSYVPAVRPRRISPFYTRLGALPAGSLLIVEAPWYYAWHQIPFPYYQQVHRQRMNVGFVAAADQFVRPGELPLVGSGLHFDNAVHVADAAKLKQRGVRYVVFHRSLRAELPSPPEEVIDVGEWIRRYAVRYGAPVYEDPDIVAFDVAAGPGTPPPGADVR
jgi:hypothetical protein